MISRTYWARVYKENSVKWYEIFKDRYTRLFSQHITISGDTLEDLNNNREKLREEIKQKYPQATEVLIN